MAEIVDLPSVCPSCGARAQRYETRLARGDKFVRLFCGNHQCRRETRALVPQMAPFAPPPSSVEQTAPARRPYLTGPLPMLRELSEPRPAKPAPRSDDAPAQPCVLEGQRWESPAGWLGEVRFVGSALATLYRVEGTTGADVGQIFLSELRARWRLLPPGELRIEPGQTWRAKSGVEWIVESVGAEGVTLKRFLVDGHHARHHARMALSERALRLECELVRPPPF